MYAIDVAGPRVWIGGAFTTIGSGASFPHIIRWESPGWVDVGGGVNSSVWALAAEGDDVWVGGPFTDAGHTSSGDHLAMFGGGTHVFSDGFETGDLTRWSGVSP